MRRVTRPEQKLDLGPLPPSAFAAPRGTAAIGTESPDALGTSPRYPSVNGRLTSASPSKEYTGSRLFPKRYVHAVLVTMHH